jgi:hypothetical protein
MTAARKSNERDFISLSIGLTIGLIVLPFILSLVLG